MCIRKHVERMCFGLGKSAMIKVKEVAVGKVISDNWIPSSYELKIFGVPSNNEGGGVGGKKLITILKCIMV